MLDLRQGVGRGVRVVVERHAGCVQWREVGGGVDRRQLSVDVRPQRARPDVASTVDEVGVYPAGRLIQLHGNDTTKRCTVNIAIYELLSAEEWGFLWSPALGLATA